MFLSPRTGATAPGANLDQVGLDKAVGALDSGAAVDRNDEDSIAATSRPEFQVRPHYQKLLNQNRRLLPGYGKPGNAAEGVPTPTCSV